MAARVEATGTTLEEFKARLPLADVVGRYVRLTKAGREYKGLCPFHKEKTPSFNVVESKGFYHCFGCGAHGTAIDFVMGVEGLDFGEAVERLADMTGIPAPARSGGNREQRQRQEDANARLYAANGAAAAWFAKVLEGERGAAARAYLERREVGRSVAATFGLGFAPDSRDGLRRALLDQRFTDEELVAAGLLALPEEGGRGGGAYDRFRDRVMFPIHDERGRVVGFGGRAMGEAARAKYLNTPETALFHKGELLYNLHRAAPAARERREIVLAEGYMDVIALAKAGIAQAVAPLGTAVTERQLGLLWRHAEAPLVCLDGDRAGLAAALRAAERALPLMQAGRTLRFAILPEGEDPDSFVARHGAAAMAEVLGRAQSLSQTLWRLESGKGGFDAPEAQAALRRRLREYVRLTADQDLRASLDVEFQRLLAEAFPRRRARGGAPSGGGRWRPGEGRPPGGGAGNGPRPGFGDRDEQRVGSSRLAAGLEGVRSLGGEDLVGPVLINPGLLNGREEDFAALDLPDRDLDRLRQEILLWCCDHPALDAEALGQHLHRHGLASVRERVLASVAKVAKLRGETAAWPDAAEWEAALARWRRSSARRDQKVSFAESVLQGGAADVAASRSSLDRLLNQRVEDGVAQPGDAGPGPPRRER